MKFVAGDQVIVFERDSTNKLMSRWIGPAQIIEPKSDNSYLVCMPNQARRVLHANF